MDADGSHQPEQLPAILAALADADLVIGARWVRGGEVRNWPARRKVLSVGANLYTKILLGMKVNDATAGYRAYRISALQTMGLDGVESQGYCFQIDLTLRAVRAGLTVAEVPITFVEREVGVSKMGQDIVLEALTNVTKWGIEHRVNQVRALVDPARRPRREPSVAVGRRDEGEP
jgi:dolichol-phosphate mannosyltransferase